MRTREGFDCITKPKMLCFLSNGSTFWKHCIVHNIVHNLHLNCVPVKIRVENSPGFGLPSVAILGSLRHKQFRHSAISTQKHVLVQKCRSHFDTGLDVSTHFLKMSFLCFHPG